MPVIAPGSKVLVTGANGFAAIHIVDALLKKGYSVRATIRSESKGTYLKKIFGKYGDKLEFVIVPDAAKVRLIRPRGVRRRVDGCSRTVLSTTLLAESTLFCIPLLPSITMSKIQKVRRSFDDQLLRFTSG